MKPSMLADTLAALIPARMPVLITGQPGIGKTDIVKQSAERAKHDALIFHPVVSDPTDFKGMPAVTSDGGAEFLPFGDLRKLLEAKKPTVAFLDDVGQAPPMVQAALMQLLLAREIDGKAISNKVTFVAATNRKSDRAGVSGVLEPVKSRFVTIIELETDLEDWCAWGVKNDMPEKLMAFIRHAPKFLDAWEAKAEIENSPTPRTIAHVGHLMNNEALPEAARWSVIKGAAGEGLANELVGFLEVYDELPDLDLALKNPDAVKVPKHEKSLAALYAFTIGIAYRVARNEKLMANFVTLLHKMDPEFGVMGMKTATQMNEGLMSTKPFGEYVVKHQELLM